MIHSSGDPGIRLFAPGDDDRPTPPDREPIGGAGGRRRQLEVIGAAEERPDAVGAAARRRSRRAGRCGVPRPRSRAPCCARISRSPCDRCWSPGCRSDRRAPRPPRIASASICRQRNVEPLDVGSGRPEGRQLHPFREPRRRRREAIATLERPADGRPCVATLGQLHDLARRRPRGAPASARRCRARRSDSRPCRRRCRAAPIRRRDRPPPRRWCRRESTCRRRPSSSAPAATSCGGMSCVMSTRVTSGQMPEDDALHRTGVMIPACRSRSAAR